MKLKTVLFSAFLLASGLFAGYALGYRHGFEENDRKWRGSVLIERDGKVAYAGPQAELVEEAPSATRWNSIPKHESSK